MASAEPRERGGRDGQADWLEEHGVLDRPFSAPARARRRCTRLDRARRHRPLPANRPVPRERPLSRMLGLVRRR